MKQNDYYVVIIKCRYPDDLIDRLYLLMVRKNNKAWGNFYYQRIYSVRVKNFKRLTTRFADKLYTRKLEYVRAWSSSKIRLILPSVHCDNLEDIINRYTKVMKNDNDADVKIICSYETR